MDNLWSPWRSSYITSAEQRSEDDCFLCHASLSDIDRQSALVVAVFPSSIVVLNRYPYNSGHLLIAPKDHISDLANISPHVAHEIMDVTQISLRILDDVLRPHGVNVGANLGAAAGAGVPGHLHIHLVPRWNGDTNFMPVLGEVKVVSEQLDDMWGRFTSAFANIATL